MRKLSFGGVIKIKVFFFFLFKGFLKISSESPLYANSLRFVLRRENQGIIRFYEWINSDLLKIENQLK